MRNSWFRIIISEQPREVAPGSPPCHRHRPQGLGEGMQPVEAPLTRPGLGWGLHGEVSGAQSWLLTVLNSAGLEPPITCQTDAHSYGDSNHRPLSFLPRTCSGLTALILKALSSRTWPRAGGQRKPGLWNTSKQPHSLSPPPWRLTNDP